MKICSKCGIEKDETEFNKRVERKCGVSSHCKDCMSLEYKRYAKEGKKHEVPPFKDLTGKSFNKLTVLEKTDRRATTSILWKCLCDCGNITFVRGTSLKNGNTKSCGCLQSALLSKPLDSNIKYGRLIILNQVKERSPSDGSIVYECLCDCGNRINVASCRLRQGTIKSCGCLKKENGIKSQKNNIRAYRISKNSDPDLEMSSKIVVLRNELSYSGLKEQVKIRDNYKCVLCDSTDALQIHHIVPLSENSELNLNINNLIVLCKDCHINKAHKESWRTIDKNTQELLITYISQTYRY